MCSFVVFLDVLTEVKQFSLETQQGKVNIIEIVDSLESTKNKYDWLLKLLKINPFSFLNRQLSNLLLI